MEKYKEIIPIFFAVDDKYIPFLSVTLESLVEKMSQEYYYVVKILCTNISEKSKEKIKEKTFLPSIDKRNAAAIYKILTHQKQRLLAND